MTNKHLLCFIDGIGERDRFDRLLERLGRDGWQAHLVSGVNEHALLPHQVPFIVDDLFPEGANELVLAALSNVPEFLALTIRLFPDLFRWSLLYGGEIDAYRVELDPVYRCLLERELDDAEGRIGPVYLSDGVTADLFPRWLAAFAKPLEDKPSVHDVASPNREGTVAYYFEGVYYRFEPKAGTAVRIVNLDGGSVPYHQTCLNTLVCGEQWIDPETVYMLKRMDASKNHYFEHYGRFSATSKSCPHVCSGSVQMPGLSLKYRWNSRRTVWSGTARRSCCRFCCKNVRRLITTNFSSNCCFMKVSGRGKNGSFICGNACASDLSVLRPTAA